MPTCCRTEISRISDETLQIQLIGNWKIGNEPASAEQLKKQLDADPAITNIVFDSRELADWDSSLLTFLLRVLVLCREKQISTDSTGLPQGVQRLVALALAVPEKKGTGKGAQKESILSRIGSSAISSMQSIVALLDFIGDSFLSFITLLRGKAHFRKSDLIVFIQDSGPQALPVVTLISVLIGLILAFVGAVQLELFGAEIYVADLVGIAMAREMGAMMTAIIMAGRTGAAFAAQLGTMQVNEEIDALKTFGFSPTEFLVLPRMLAMCLMMPLLCIYADIMGMLGGLFVGVAMLDIPLIQYFHETSAAVGLDDVAVGLVKSVVFGVIIAYAGCYQGMRCGRSASAVGEATTSAVVAAIVAIIVFDGIFAVLTNMLSI